MMLETLIKVWSHENQTLIFFFFVLEKKGVFHFIEKNFFEMIDASF